jgi:hypothetical protein
MGPSRSRDWERGKLTRGRGGQDQVLRDRRAAWSFTVGMAVVCSRLVWPLLLLPLACSKINPWKGDDLAHIVPFPPSPTKSLL